MKTNFIYFACAFAWLTSCAQPRYESVTPAPPSSPTQEKSEADCSSKFQKVDLCLSWSWEKKPTDQDMGSLVFRTYRANNYDRSPVMTDPALAPAVVLWMPEMGHGSSPTSISHLDTGTYRASDVFFVMPGHWQIKFQLKNGNTVEDELVVSITI